MTSIRQSVETNKRILIAIFVLIAVIGVFLFRFYTTQKRENRALRIKILSMQENRRTPKPWSQLTTRPATATATTPAAAVTPASNTQTTTPVVQNSNSQPIDAMDTQTLASKLNTQMRRVKNLDVTSIDNNIAIADEIISREPDSYGAYKAKLISLLTKEGKFNQALDDAEVDSVLESMAQFNTANDSLARREAALISNSNADIQNVEAQLENVARQRETLESQLSSFDPNSEEYQNMNAQMQQLDEQELQLASNIESLENNLASSTSQLYNEDVVEIPFMRMMAKGDYEGVMDNAQTFMDQFPTSPNGYFYMVRALEMQGERDQAMNLIQNSRLPQDAQQALLQRLDAQQGEDPKNYWQKLSF